MRELGPASVTQLLQDWRAGDDHALETLLPLIYGELRRMAAKQLRHESAGLTLETHDLVHEAFLRMVGQRRVDWHDRAHFFAVSARMMRRILVDHARHRGRRKRGGAALRVPLAELEMPAPAGPPDWLALDQALGDLAQEDAQLANLVELRFFGGLDLDETAKVLGLSRATVRRRWQLAKSWLFLRLGEGAPAGAG